VAQEKGVILPMNNSISYIAVEGAIGAGKSSLAKMLADKLNAKTILENFEDNPYLEKFYHSPAEYSFRTQVFFLVERYTQLQQLQQKDLFESYIISDYIFEKDKIFAFMNLSDDELKTYEAISASFERNIVQPDLVIYLQSSAAKLMQNIKQRNRNIEREITEDYVSDLNDAYNYFFSRFKNAKVMIVNCEEVDFTNNKLDFEKLFKEIFKEERSAIEYYNPSLRKTAL